MLCAVYTASLERSIKQNKNVEKIGWLGHALTQAVIDQVYSWYIKPADHFQLLYSSPADLLSRAVECLVLSSYVKTMSPNYKIIYFDARGRAECLRLLFVKAGRKFEDVRLTHETWAAEKPNTPFGQLPVIEIDGKRYGQSCAIGSYLAREFCLYGKSNLDALIIDQVVHLGLDLMNSYVKAHFEKDETKKAELMKTLTEVTAPKYLNDIDKLLTETGFFVGNSITYGDIFTFDFLDNLCRRKILTTANHPKVQALVEAVANDEKIKPYLSTRKETEN